MTTTALSRPPAKTTIKLKYTDRWVLLLALGWLAQLAFRLILAIGQTVPTFIPDESGYLLAARLLAGRASSDLSGRTFYQAGYPLLISPAYWFTDDPTVVYRLVIGINCIVGASLLILAYLALRRMDLPRTRAYVFAHLIALLPSAVYYSRFALTDAILPVLVLGWLLLVHTWLTRSGRVYGVAATAVAAFAYTVHPRGIVILLVQVGLLIAVAVRGRRAAVHDVAAMGQVLVTVTALGWALNFWVRHQIYPSGVAPLGDWLFGRLTSWAGLVRTFSLAAGQIWYLIVSTWGLAGLGLVTLAVIAARRHTSQVPRTMACAILATVIGISLATSAALPDEHTVANLAYGRYLSCMAPVLVLVGLALLARTSPLILARAGLAVTALAILLGGIVWAYGGTALTHNFFGDFDFPETSFLTWNWNALKLWPATAAGLLILTLILLIMASCPAKRALVLVAVGLASLNLSVSVVTAKQVSWHWASLLQSATELKTSKLRADDRVAVNYPDLSWRIWVPQAFGVRSHFIPLNRFYNGPPPAGVTLVIVPWPQGTSPRQSWPGAPPTWRMVTAHQTFTGNWVAWRPISRTTAR